MCGIAGILSPQASSVQAQSLQSDIDRSHSLGDQAKSAIDPAVIKRLASKLKAMQDALTHRGPDSKGAFFSPSYQAALAHTRLSIIDLSNGGHQPMSAANQRYTITFNGEIYNYKKLRTQLEVEGEEFESDSDTEVILKLYISKGAACVQLLRGMFAFLIWDEQEQKAFAARDALGIKPFYYLKSDGSFIFASELRAVLASGYSSRRISSRGVMSYLLKGTVAEPDTAIKNLKMLPAGTYLTWKSGKTKLHRYWNLDFSVQHFSGLKAIEVTRTALEHSIRAHLVSDVPVGIFLSGGIDSTALVAIASKLSKKQINTYSIAFESPEWNEADIAKRVAQHFGTNHTEFLITAKIARPLFNQFLLDIDQPSIDGFNTYCVSKLASEAGEKVVLSGLGGDELFAGYTTFEVLPEMMRKSRLLRKLNFMLKPLSKALYKTLSPRQRRISDALNNSHSLTAAHQSFRGIFSISEAYELTNIVCNKAPKEIFVAEPNHPSEADNISHLELSTYLRNQLLRDSDVASMAWGLELRVPFIDRVFIEQISTISSDIRLQQGKKLLIDCVPELPSWVVNRPKQGFRFPFDEWFESSWNDMPMPVTPKWIPLQPWYRRWSLVVLNDWKARHVK
ncbi:MAG: asparagine synthase (glutamine-hydrolyzing) [Arenicella sp.]|jgi:asparagine synthase (glutamine-hydrolysing)